MNLLCDKYVGMFRTRETNKYNVFMMIKNSTNLKDVRKISQIENIMEFDGSWKKC